MKHTPKKLYISAIGRHLCLFTAVCLVIGVIFHIRYADAYDYDKPFSSTVFVEPTFPPPPIVPKLSPVQTGFAPNPSVDTTGWTFQGVASGSSEHASATDSRDAAVSESNSHNNNASTFGSLIPNASAAGTRLANSTNEDENTLRLHVPRALAAGAESYANSDEEQDITVTKTDTLETAEPGDMITYRITVTNNTDEPIPNVTITDFMPSFVNPTAATPVAYMRDDVVWWENQTISPGETIFYVRVHIDETAFDGVLLENRAEVSGLNISLSATDTTLIMRPAPPEPVAPTVDTGTGIGLFLVTAGAIAGWGSLTTRKLFK